MAAFELIDCCTQFVVVDKSPGVGFHSEEGQPGLVPQLECELQLGKLYPVHRLDRMTSGLLLLARSPEAAEALNKQFRAHLIEKYYLALSDRKPRKKQGLISGDMVKARRGSWKLLKTQQDPARTRFFSFGLGAGKRLYLLKPQTGRTHQLRVALKSIGAPIIGDQRYYPQAAKNSVAGRGYLHAYGLGFELEGRHHFYCCPPSQGALF